MGKYKWKYCHSQGLLYPTEAKAVCRRHAERKGQLCTWRIALLAPEPLQHKPLNPPMSRPYQVSFFNCKVCLCIVEVVVGSANCHSDCLELLVDLGQVVHLRYCYCFYLCLSQVHHIFGVTVYYFHCPLNITYRLRTTGRQDHYRN